MTSTLKKNMRITKVNRRQCLRWEIELHWDNKIMCSPQAAYQYGMKVSDGRKTKGKIGQKNEKAKLDKEWNKVNRRII